MDRIGAARALEIHGLERGRSKSTFTSWPAHRIEDLSGIKRPPRAEYLGVVTNDITPVLGTIPLDLLSHDDISRLVEMRRPCSA